MEINDPPYDLTLEAFLPFTLMSTGLVNKEGNLLGPYYMPDTVLVSIFYWVRKRCKHLRVERGAHAEAVLGAPLLS